MAKKKAPKVELPPLPQPRTRAEFDAMLAAAPGPVLIDFSQADCDACDSDDTALRKLAAGGKCSNATIMKVNCEDIPELADAWGVNATPTLLFAQRAADMTAENAKRYEEADSPVEEVEPGLALRRKMKCTR